MFAKFKLIMFVCACWCACVHVLVCLHAMFCGLVLWLVVEGTCEWPCCASCPAACLCAFGKEGGLARALVAIGL